MPRLLHQLRGLGGVSPSAEPQRCAHPWPVQCSRAGLSFCTSFWMLVKNLFIFSCHHEVWASCLSFSVPEQLCNLNSLLPFIPIFWLLFSFCLFSEVPSLPFLGRMSLNQCFLIFLLCLSLKCISELLKILFRLGNLALFRGQNSP